MTMKYDRGIRWIHAGLVLTVLVQLFCSLFMRIGEPASAGIRYTLFHVHEWSGLCVVCLVLAHWLWQLGGHVKNGWGHLFPWFSKIRLQRLGSDLRALPGWIRNGFPDQREETLPLAGAVHGLGLLAVSGMALTGAALFYALVISGGMSPFFRSVAAVHSFVAGFLWAYLIGHAGLAFYHQFSGSPLVSDMFNLVRK